MSTSLVANPVVLLLAALVVPFVAVGLAVAFAKGLGWVAEDRRRGHLVVLSLAACYLCLAVLSLVGAESARAGIIYGVLGVLWAGLAWYNRLGPGSRGDHGSEGR